MYPAELKDLRGSIAVYCREFKEVIDGLPDDKSWLKAKLAFIHGEFASLLPCEDEPGDDEDPPTDYAKMLRNINARLERAIRVSKTSNGEARYRKVVEDELEDTLFGYKCLAREIDEGD